MLLTALIVSLTAVTQGPPVFEPADAWLTPAFRIGEAFGPPETAFGRITDVAVASDGTVFILDGQARTVRRFSATGEFIRAFGREGGGPGEFLSPVRIWVDTALVVSDVQASRQTVFSLDDETVLTYPISRPTARAPVTMVPMRGARLALWSAVGFGISDGRPARDPVHRLLISGPGATQLDTLLEVRSGSARWHPVGRDLPFGIVRTSFGNGGAWDSAGDSLIVGEDGYSGEVTWYCFTSAEMSRCGTANVGLAALPVKEDDIQSLVRTAQEKYPGNGRLTVSEVPAYWSVADHLVIGHDELVWVEHTVEEGSKPRWTVLNRNGEVVRRVELPMPGRIHVVTAGYLYFATKDELDVPYLMIYRWH